MGLKVSLKLKKIDTLFFLILCNHFKSLMYDVIKCHKENPTALHTPLHYGGNIENLEPL